MGVGHSVRTATLALVLGMTVVMSGCAVLGGGDDSTELTAAELTSQAESKADDGQDDAAVELLKKVTLKNPVDPDPWLKIARIRFQSDDYVDALLASEEVISRDRTNEAGNSIALVTSLRLAERSIGLLRSGTDLEGSMRDQAHQLAAKLRKTLGEDVLLPAGDESHTNKKTHRSKRHVSHKSSTKKVTHSASHKTKAKSSGSSATSTAAEKKKSGSNSNSQTPAKQDDNGDDGSMNPFETLQKLPQ